VKYLHKSLNQQINYDEYKTELFPNFSVQAAPGAKVGDDQFLTNRVGSTGAMYSFIYPNLMLNRYGNWLDINWVVPINQQQTLVYFNYFYSEEPNKDNQHLIDKSIEESDRIQKEDEMISKRVQVGISSSGYQVGRYAPNVETAAYHFHQLLHKSFTSK